MEKVVAFVEIMNGYNYNNFKLCLPCPEGSSLAEINEIRKNCQRLVDEAIRQAKLSDQNKSEKLKLESMLENKKNFLEYTEEKLENVKNIDLTVEAYRNYTQGYLDNQIKKLENEIHQIKLDIEHYTFLVENFKEYNYED